MRARCALAVVVVAVLVSGCTISQRTTGGTPGPSIGLESPAPATRGPDQTPGEGDPSQPDEHAAEDPPWAAPALTAGEVLAVYVDEWNKAENKATCGLLAPERAPDPNGAARSANFGSGWAVAYDVPGAPGVRADGTDCADCGRGTFGVAGTGVDFQPDDLQGFPQRIPWSDGTQAGYRIDGAYSLAYVQVNGEACLYNVWSYAGEQSLLDLLRSLRRVVVPQ